MINAETFPAWRARASALSRALVLRSTETLNVSVAPARRFRLAERPFVLRGTFMLSTVAHRGACGEAQRGADGGVLQPGAWMTPGESVGMSTPASSSKRYWASEPLNHQLILRVGALSWIG